MEYEDIIFYVPCRVVALEKSRLAVIRPWRLLGMKINDAASLSTAGIKIDLLATNLFLIERQQSPTGERHCHGTNSKSHLIGVNRKMSLCSQPLGSEQTLARSGV
jgi:hypothetical protein